MYLCWKNCKEKASARNKFLRCTEWKRPMCVKGTYQSMYKMLWVSISRPWQWQVSISRPWQWQVSIISNVTVTGKHHQQRDSDTGGYGYLLTRNLQELQFAHFFLLKRAVMPPYSTSTCGACGDLEIASCIIWYIDILRVYYLRSIVYYVVGLVDIYMIYDRITESKGVNIPYDRTTYTLDRISTAVRPVSRCGGVPVVGPRVYR